MQIATQNSDARTASPSELLVGVAKGQPLHETMASFEKIRADKSDARVRVIRNEARLIRACGVGAYLQ